MSNRYWIALAASLAVCQSAAGGARAAGGDAGKTLLSSRDNQCGDLLKPFELVHPAASETSHADQVMGAIANTICNVRLLRNEYQGWTERPTYSDGTRVEDKSGHEVEIKHAGKIQIKRNWQSSIDSSLIGLGIASVGAAFYGAPVNAIGGVALGASGLQQYRSYYDPGGEGLTYITAAKAARCVATNAEPLMNDSPATLWTAIAVLAKAMDEAQSAYAQLQSSNTTAALASSEPSASAGSEHGAKTKTPSTQDQQAVQAKAAQLKSQGATAGSDAMAAANTAMIAALGEAHAYNDASAKIDEAHDAIKNYVDLKLHRIGPTYSDIQSALTTAINTAASLQSNVQQAQSQLIAAVKSNATASATSGGSSSGVAPSVANVNSLADAISASSQTKGGAVAPSPCAASPASGSTQDGACSAPTVEGAAQANSAVVANLIAATTNVLNLISARRYTTIDNQVSVACVAGLGS